MQEVVETNESSEHIAECPVCVPTNYKSDLIGVCDHHLHGLVILPTLFRLVLSVSKESESYFCSEPVTNDEL